MGFFSDAAAGVSDFIGGGSSGGSGGTLSTIIGAASQIGSVILQNNANKDAARRVQSGFEGVTNATLAGQALLEPIVAGGQVGLRRLQNVAAEPPGRLRPEQVQEREDVTRQATNLISTTGLRGAGRAVAAAAGDVGNRFTADAIAENRRRSDTAAQELSRTGLSATGAQADLGVTGARAGLGGDIERGQADIENSTNVGTAISAIASLIGDEERRRDRNSSRSRTPVTV